ncbi:MAG: ribonuclease Y [Planctomycetia bacterium]|nr:ribonuclease Y [Planctomycetia bacterium]
MEWITGTIGTSVGALITFFWIRSLDRLRHRGARSEAEEILQSAHREVDALRREFELEQKEERLRQKEEGEQELRRLRDGIHERERLLDKREQQLDQQTDQLRKQEAAAEGAHRKALERSAAAEDRKRDLDALVERQERILFEQSGLSREEATRRLFEKLNRELNEEIGSRILRHEKRVLELAEIRSREILLSAIQRYAAPHTAETTTSTVDIPNDEMKGRIIGREGRNIRTFEKVTGVDVIIDDTPGVVIVSAFDTIRREVARLALSRLIVDGRIHPTRIEEIVEETRQELDHHIMQLGEDAVQEAGVHGLHERLVGMLGRLHFRTSYSQNVLRHSSEVAFLAGGIAEELGYDARLARRAGLLHDIGKAGDHDAEGGHPKVGAEILRRCGESKEVVAAAAGHHDDVRLEHPYTVIVAAADACSASRPGARRETLERYIRRMEELEEIATNFGGVEHAFAIQAGREVRVILSARETTDESAAKICRELARAYEEQLTYPGEIRVTVLRESRYVEVAH